MNNIISNYVERLTKEDIIKFANMNNLSVSDSEIDFVYTFIKRNYKSVLNNTNKDLENGYSKNIRNHKKHRYK